MYGFVFLPSNDHLLNSLYIYRLIDTLIRIKVLHFRPESPSDPYCRDLMETEIQIKILASFAIFTETFLNV